jgi:hypothetical protein
VHSEAQWCFSAGKKALMSSEMTGNDSEKGTIGSSLREIGYEITETVREMTEMVGKIT